MSIYATLWQLKFPAFETQRTRICDALRGEKPRVIATSLVPGKRMRVTFEDGTTKEVDVPGNLH